MTVQKIITYLYYNHLRAIISSQQFIERNLRVTGLAKSASASIKINHTDHSCRICGRVILLYRLMIVGTSRKPDTVYTGGYFHINCWFLFNNHPHNQEVYLMSKKAYDEARFPDLQPIGPMLEEMQRWDTTHKHLVNVEIVILEFEPIETQYGDALLANCIVRGEPKVVLIGGEVLKQQLEVVADKLPVLATIIRTGAYYTFS